MKSFAKIATLTARILYVKAPKFSMINVQVFLVSITQKIFQLPQQMSLPKMFNAHIYGNCKANENAGMALGSIGESPTVLHGLNKKQKAMYAKKT